MLVPSCVSRALLPALALLLGAADAPPPRVTELRPLALQSGINQVERLGPDGRAGVITLAWRDNGNAWGYDLYTVLLPGKDGWQVVGVERPGQDAEFSDTIRDSPHTGEDAISAVRFARGLVDGHPATLLLEAVRAWQDTPYDPAPASYNVYALVPNDDGVGQTVDYFKRVAHRDLPEPYCHAEMALSRGSGLPPRPGYAGKPTPTGC